jgi:thiamine biosynthesis protein ThiS
MIINGNEVALQARVSLREYLEGNGYDLRKVAVEKNGVIVPKGAFDGESLSDCDALEIVRFVGGG